VESIIDRRLVLSHCRAVHRRPTTGSLSLDFSLHLSRPQLLALSCSLALSPSRSLALCSPALSLSCSLALAFFVSSHSCTDHVFSVSGSWPLSHSRSHSLTLLLSLALSPSGSLSRSLALSLSRSCFLALRVFRTKTAWMATNDRRWVFFLSLFLTGPPTSAYRIVSTKRQTMGFLSLSLSLSLFHTSLTSLALSLSRFLTFLFSRSLALSLCRSLTLALFLFVSFIAVLTTCSLSLVHGLSLTLALILLLSLSLALSPSRSLDLSLSRSCFLALRVFRTKAAWMATNDRRWVFFLSLFLTGPPTSAYRIVSTKRQTMGLLSFSLSPSHTSLTSLALSLCRSLALHVFTTKMA